MGTGYLVDSNTVIDMLMLRMPETGLKFLYELKPAISIITRIELFCKSQLGLDELDKLNRFLPQAVIYQITEGLAIKTIDIRLKYKIKLPDAIIAATALYHNLTLVTHNIKILKKLKD